MFEDSCDGNVDERRTEVGYYTNDDDDDDDDFLVE